jgi:CRISPR-associated protein Cmr4
MNTHVFKITAKTNLHVGNESGGDFTIIDKAIQRDPLTGLPCINSSSLKGAIKEFCVHEAKLNNVLELFGSDIDLTTGKIKDKDKTKKGKAVFFDAKLLYLPQQDDNTLFHFETTPNIIAMMNNRVKLFDSNFKYEAETIVADKPVVVLVDKDEEPKTADKQFEDKCSDDNLPIIARNVLENGESKNLWYEQVLPAETVLYTIIQEEGKDLQEALDGKIVQIGANATIGYGYCKFELLK